ncbi:hypothetical protein [Nitrosomonas marina]|uniref:Uncharacterized protein n=1 Tax=Nitrosomonas marina TaxID=917 RepID=A0A1H8E399_9PROT|nr:hypothetical protein [Nitrosomonas marina]SEN13942.1 hypothetical protein SAMN05216325_108106 [Nitrosomonas marina]
MIAQRTMIADIHNSPKMVAQRKQIHSIQNSPRITAQYRQAKPDSIRPSPVFPATVAQRVIKLDGADIDTAQLLAESADKAEKIIIANWDWSETVHDFTTNEARNLSAKQSLLNAIQVAKSKDKDVPALFSAANLKFLTKAEGRLPTLYFVQGADSGRLRQQHGGGPAVSSEVNKIDYFLPQNPRCSISTRSPCRP